MGMAWRASGRLTKKRRKEEIASFSVNGTNERDPLEKEEANELRNCRKREGHEGHGERGT